ncbi:hypothetical protein ACLB2K_059656 [Fragaria x ananassa]
MDGVRRQVGWKNAFSVSCKFEKKSHGKRVSRARGICLLWTDDIRVSLKSYSEIHIDVMVRGLEDDQEWRFTGVYGEPRAENRHQTWSLIKKLGREKTKMWVMGGNFNEIASSVEKEGGVRSDRIGRWKPLKKLWRSDHLPIILEVRKRKKRWRPKRRRFRLEEFWLREEDCKQVVESGWESGTGSCPYSKLRNKIQNTRDLLLSWSKERFGSLREKIARTTERLGELYDKGQPSFSDEVRGELEKQLRELLQKEQAFWQQRSRVLWLAVGDLNTKYFHQKASNRRKKNTLRGLYNSGGQWCVEEGEIQAIVLDYYTSLFTTPNPAVDFEDLHGVPRVITEEVNQSLMREVITAEEVWRALKQMHPSKRPGPDGLSSIFYQQFWDVVGRDVVEDVKGFLYSEEFLRDINCTWVTLIPKVKKPENMQQLRPISLCNVIYKISSKLLANHLKPILDSISSPFQSAFVLSRLITDNSLFAFEISHCLKKRRRGKVGYGAL